MENRRLGGILFGIGAAIGAVFLMLRASLSQQQQLLCTPSPACATFNSYLTASNIIIGIISAVVSLGFYLLFFDRGAQAIIERLEQEKHRLVQGDKQRIISALLDANEQKIFNAIREQQGISQHTLALRTDLSKSLVSSILSTFERKHLIRREKNGKTYAVYFAEEI